MTVFLVIGAIVGGFFGKDAMRGFLGAGIGLLLATIGSSGFGGLRFTFNQGFLIDGIPLVVVIIAFLAGPEAFRLLVDNRRTLSDGERIDPTEQKERNRVTRADVRLLIPTWIRGSLLGTAAAGRAEIIERIIAKVNGDIITLSEFQERQLAAAQAARVTPEQIGAFYYCLSFRMP